MSERDKPDPEVERYLEEKRRQAAQAQAAISASMSSHPSKQKMQPSAPEREKK